MAIVETCSSFGEAAGEVAIEAAEETASSAASNAEGAIADSGAGVAGEVPEAGGGTSSTTGSNPSSAPGALQEQDAAETSDDITRLRKTAAKYKGNSVYEDAGGRQYYKNGDNWFKESDRRFNARTSKTTNFQSLKPDSVGSFFKAMVPGKTAIMIGAMGAIGSIQPVEQSLKGNPNEQMELEQGYVSQAGVESQTLTLESNKNSNQVNTVEKMQIQSSEQANSTLGSEISQALQAISIIGSLGQG
ncbi:MAG: hypothetical protein S4CHLAM107_11710 [Chlamydiia bacterium]|nr:hypothetical protein [Chlamydiia bacterium]